MRARFRATAFLLYILLIILTLMDEITFWTYVSLLLAALIADVAADCIPSKKTENERD